MFTKYPVVVNHVNPKTHDVKKYIFVGDSPVPVKSCLQNYIKNGGTTVLLEQYYGKHWKSSLDLEPVKGGDSDLLDISDILETEPSPGPQPTPHIPPKQNSIQIVENVFFYPEDRISEVKEKINLAIPELSMFKQHLYTKVTGPLSYRILCDTVLHVNIEQPSTTKILEIPIDMNMYQNHDSCVVEGTDWFVTLGEVYTQHNVRHFNVVSIDSYVASIQSELAELSRTDAYQFQLIYYAFVMKYWPMLSLNAFTTFVTDPNDMSATYPDLCASLPALQHKYKIESETLNRKYQLLQTAPSDLAKYAPEQAHLLSKSKNKIIDVAIRGAMLASETHSRSMMGYIKVNVRNLFEKLHVDDTMPFIRASLMSDTGMLLVSKVRSPMLVEGDDKDTPRIFEKIKYKIAIPNPNMILMVVPVNHDLYMIFTLDHHGRYQVKSAWGEEIQVDFATIFQMAETYVNPIIIRINALGRGVFDSANVLPLISKSTCRFTGLSLSLFYKMPVNSEKFHILGDLLKRDLESGILKLSQEAPEINTYDYLLMKGMTNYNLRDMEHVYALNYYDYLTNAKTKQKWMQLFGQGRSMKFIYRSTDIKIEVQDLREKEFTYFYEYVISLLYEFEHTKTTSAKKRPDEIKTNRLKLLKSKDPELYTFKQFGSDVVFSRICQKEHQPLMYEPNELQNIDKTLQKKAVKFWNYTTNQPVYYVCTNPAYPYLNFLVGYHPKGYCLPCCKKTKAEDVVVSNSKKNVVYHTCMEQHRYIEGDTQIKSSRHIMNYGKIIDVGRIGNLPEIIAKYIMYNLEYQDDAAFKTGGGVMKKPNYYLYGVSQNSAAVSNIGAGYAIAAALNMSFSEFVEKCVMYFRTYSGNLDHFKILYNGELGTFFRNMQEMLQHMFELFVDEHVQFTDVKKFTGWNELFAELAEMCFGKRVLLFDDTSIDITGTSTKSHKVVENIEFVIPNSDISAEIMNIQDIIPLTMDYIVLLRKRKKSKILFSSNHVYYPVFVFVPQIYFRSMHIENKIFNGNDEIIKLFRSAIESSIPKDQNSSITSRTVYDFAHASGLVVKKYYMNSRDLCYAVMISTGNKQFIWPVGYSHFREDVLSTYDTYTRTESTATFAEWKIIIQRYNKHVLQLSEAAGRYQINPEQSQYKSQWNQRECSVIPVSTFLKVEKFLAITSDTDQIIGFISGGLYYYFSQMNMTEKRYAALLQESMQEYSVLAENFKKIRARQSVYYLSYDPDDVNSNLFQEPMAHDHKLLRKGMYDKYIYYMYVIEVISHLDRERDKRIRDQLKTCVTSMNIKKTESIEAMYEKLQGIVSHEDDMEKIKNHMNYAIGENFSKAQLLKLLDTDTFEFDRVTLLHWKKLSDAGDSTALRKSVAAITADVTIIAEPDDSNDVVFVPCSVGNLENCKNGRLIIKREDRDTLIDLLVDDLCNSLKRDYLLSSIIMQNTRDNFLFSRKKGEEIYIKHG
jgi:hypothetical protein